MAAAAGTRGPIPKRTEQRRRRNATGGVTKAKSSTARTGSRKARRPAVDPHWHPEAKRLYLSLAESGQSVFMEPSDWAYAHYWASQVSRYIRADKLSGQMFTALDAAAARLMFTEGDRRRLRIELDREKDVGVDPDKVAGVTAIADWQAKLGPGGG